MRVGLDSAGQTTRHWPVPLASVRLPDQPREPGHNSPCHNHHLCRLFLSDIISFGCRRQRRPAVPCPCMGIPGALPLHPSRRFAEKYYSTPLLRIGHFSIQNPLTHTPPGHASVRKHPRSFLRSRRKIGDHIISLYDFSLISPAAFARA